MIDTPGDLLGSPDHVKSGISTDVFILLLPLILFWSPPPFLPGISKLLDLIEIDNRRIRRDRQTVEAPLNPPLL